MASLKNTAAVNCAAALRSFPETKCTTQPDQCREKRTNVARGHNSPVVEDAIILLAPCSPSGLLLVHLGNTRQNTLSSATEEQEYEKEQERMSKSSTSITSSCSISSALGVSSSLILRPSKRKRSEVTGTPTCTKQNQFKNEHFGVNIPSHCSSS